MNNDDNVEGTKNQAVVKGSEQIVNRAHDAAESLKSSAHDQIEAVKERAETGRDQAAERIRRVGTAMRSVGQELRDQDDAFVAKYAESIGTGIDRVATYVSVLEPGSLVADATRLARSRPAWFFGGAFLAGLAAGRFLKSSRPDAGVGKVDRQSSPNRYPPYAAQRYPSAGNWRPGEDISTRGVFDSDEGRTP